jgi:hypothetical protein
MATESKHLVWRRALHFIRWRYVHIIRRGSFNFFGRRYVDILRWRYVDVIRRWIVYFFWRWLVNIIWRWIVYFFGRWLVDIVRRGVIYFLRWWHVYLFREHLSKQYSPLACIFEGIGSKGLSSSGKFDSAASSKISMAREFFLK